jgi:sigma-E factor negative regulatory protein RseC
MLEEVGTVVKIDADALWVATVQKSACGSCSAQKGCGQQVLGKVFSTSSAIRVLLAGHSPDTFALEQQVRIGIPEDVVVKGALLVYLLPLAAMILFAWIGYNLGQSEGISALAALLGLVLGGWLVRSHAAKHANDPRMQPVVLGSCH